jgi:hypothetical protein
MMLQEPGLAYSDILARGLATRGRVHALLKGLAVVLGLLALRVLLR